MPAFSSSLLYCANSFFVRPATSATLSPVSPKIIEASDARSVSSATLLSEDTISSYTSAALFVAPLAVVVETPKRSSVSMYAVPLPLAIDDITELSFESALS